MKLPQRAELERFARMIGKDIVNVAPGGFSPIGQHVFYLTFEDGTTKEVREIFVLYIQDKEVFTSVFHYEAEEKGEEAAGERYTIRREYR